MTNRARLQRFAWLSIGAAIATIALKTGAWWVTGSVGLLSDAAESVVNLVAAVVALIALRVAARPADDNHNFGHAKAEYFSAGVEGAMIFVAAAVILVAAVERLLHPRPLESLGVGVLISVVAAALNGAVALILIRAGRQYRSITLTADGKHLLTDLVTTVGVVVGIIVVAVTGWERLDPVIAIAVAINILFVGYRLVVESTSGLMDAVLPAAEVAEIDGVLDGFRSDDVEFHDVRTRESGHLRFVQMHMLVPGRWSVQEGHDLAEAVEGRLDEAVEDLVVTIHIEPLEDPRSYEAHRRP
ncbi:MAG TPA: cation diffusion facilitator family transporter [Gordonia sp. (in: high G+C Gram-positive bacteria)]|uniref:cation diffusion facilitator family transporter n=1 Tax=unclassified Gordonia (in: high G+C Gram-positive bacteria) TaxID=2657482 RepID=UPI0025C314C2|nr:MULTISPECIES: cation diffusion facilitator family transporter [unclassified Gordonia (in: high G+C Gram-positive bacteria)]HNP56496.1 cation diffusion facilitator family transporter [Gordonia sp. (in: high G+C Gram-positive bacteria)]HRC50651.1 cation diffusion facilitator family transporter [Gordonia sp. (in: high G+C Gram-positive bacteria)]